MTAAVKRWTETAGRAVVFERAQELCEVGIPDLCRIRAPRWEGEWSHRLSRKQGGGWEPWNGCRACAQCHSWIEGHWDSAKDHGLRVPSWGDPQTTPVYLRLQPWWHGWWYLDDTGLYVSDGAAERAAELGMPEVPALPERRTT